MQPVRGSGGMLSLYGKIYGVDNQTACNEIKDALGRNEQAPAYQVKKREIIPKEPEMENAPPAPDAVRHKTYSMFLQSKLFDSSQKKEAEAMMYQKIIVPVDHGNRNMKTEHKIFTSGFVEGDCRPALGEYLQYNGRYYALTEQRIPYMRDKTLDDRFFILTLFAVAMEADIPKWKRGRLIRLWIWLGRWLKYISVSTKNFSESDSVESSDMLGKVI